MHDRLAELAGLCREHAHHIETAAADRAKEVRAQVDRLTAELAAEAKELEQRAKDAAKNGQDLAASEAATAARDIRSALDRAAEAVTVKAPASKRNTSAAKAPEQT